jgi:hypothetical protein
MVARLLDKLIAKFLGLFSTTTSAIVFIPSDNHEEIPHISTSSGNVQQAILNFEDRATAISNYSIESDTITLFYLR